MTKAAKFTAALRREYQPYVDKVIRTLITKGKTQAEAVERALDLRDAKITAAQKLPLKLS